jgi:hypothetical protein
MRPTRSAQQDDECEHEGGESSCSLARMWNKDKRSTRGRAASNGESLLQVIYTKS